MKKSSVLLFFVVGSLCFINGYAKNPVLKKHDVVVEEKKADDNSEEAYGRSYVVKSKSDIHKEQGRLRVNKNKETAKSKKLKKDKQRAKQGRRPENTKHIRKEKPRPGRYSLEKDKGHK